jgi:hypothetical protein
LAGVEGILALSQSIPGAGRRPLARDAIATALLLVLLAYTSAVQVAKDLATAPLATRADTQKMLVKLPRESFPWLYWMPGMPSLLGLYDAVTPYLAAHGVAAPYAEHKFFWKQEMANFAPYEALRGSGGLPEDAVTSRGSIGISGYYLADLELIDAKGLTDAHVARLPVLRTNDQRYMAHDRSADWPYLEKRGFNLMVQPAARSAEAALERSNYALRIRDDLWMPFDVLSTTWADRAFRGGQEVRTWKLLRPIGCFAEDDGCVPRTTPMADPCRTFAVLLATLPGVVLFAPSAHALPTSGRSLAIGDFDGDEATDYAYGYPEHDDAKGRVIVVYATERM